MSHPSSPVAGRHWLGCSAATKRWKTCRKLWRSRVRPWDAVELWPWMAMDHPKGKSMPWIIQWIGLRENLQETIDFTIKYGVNFPLNQSIESWPIAMIAMVAFIFPGYFDRTYHSSMIRPEFLLSSLIARGYGFWKWFKQQSYFGVLNTTSSWGEMGLWYVSPPGNGGAP